MIHSLTCILFQMDRPTDLRFNANPPPNNLVVAGGDTFTFDTEKLVLEAGDKIITDPARTMLTWWQQLVIWKYK